MRSVGPASSGKAPNHFLPLNSLLGGCPAFVRDERVLFTRTCLVPVVRFLGATRTRAVDAFTGLFFFLAMVKRS